MQGNYGEILITSMLHNDFVPFRNAFLLELLCFSDSESETSYRQVLIE